MDDLFNKAIVFIYPDGEIEAIPIGTIKSHSLVLKEHLEHSKRFYDLCSHLNFDIGIHMHIDHVLLINGVIAIYNYNLRDIIEDPSYLYNYPPYFDVFIGNKFYSEKQKSIYEELSAKYADLFVLRLWDADRKEFVPDQMPNSGVSL